MFTPLDFQDDVMDVAQEVEAPAQSGRCQCDHSFGTCPGVQACPFADTDEEEF